MIRGTVAVLLILLAVVVLTTCTAQANPRLTFCPPEPLPQVAKLPDGTEIVYAEAAYDPVERYLVLRPWPSRIACDGFEG